MSLTLIEPLEAAQKAAFDALNWAYRDYLLTFPEPVLSVVRAQYPDDKYRALLDAELRPPAGIKRLALLGGAPVACGTVQTIAPGDAEIKRVYVDPAARGSGFGKALMAQLISDCRQMGFRRILMDTGAHMKVAQGLYDGMGFNRRPPYQPLPAAFEPFLVFFEMPLSQP